MMKCFTIASFLTLFSICSFAQQYNISGVVIDSETEETLIGATILYGEGKGVITDVNGAYSLSLPAGKQTLTVTFVGYEDQQESVSLTKNTTVINI